MHWILTLLLSLPSAFALAPDTTDPKQIMEALEGRETGDRGTSKIAITVTDAAGRERTRAVVTRGMDFPEGKKQLMLFESPADVRNAGLLSVDYDDGNKPDDQWLYLPSLGKTTRISGADKSGSFMGTDLTFSDMTRKDPDQYDYTMVQQSDAVEGEDCWVIEARPKTDKEKTETGYLKTQVWVSKSKLVPMQVKAWVVEGKKLKYSKFEDYKQVGGIWVAHRIVVRTVKDNTPVSTSTLVMSEVTFSNPAVTDAEFTERRLEQGL